MSSPAPVWTPSGHLRDEQDIVWLVDIATLDYVRQSVRHVPFRRRRPGRSYHSGRLVGYSQLHSTAPGSHGMFLRRLFWLAEHDRSEQPDGVYRSGAPVEAVDPRTVKAGYPGRLTIRAWGTPIEEEH